MELIRAVSARGTYGSRGTLGGSDRGVRRVAPTFGKVLNLTASHKCGGRIAVESDAERLVAHMLTIDPRVNRFEPQPFTVDLVEGRVLRTKEALAAARANCKGSKVPWFYTPDFAIQWHDAPRSTLEVKLDGFEGDETYQAKLETAQRVLESAGYRFQLAVFPNAPKHPLRANLPLLRQAAHRHDLRPTDELLTCIEALCGERPMRLGDMCARLCISPNLVPVLLTAGTLQAEVARHRIFAEMPVEAAFGDLGHLQLLDGLLR